MVMTHDVLNVSWFSKVANEADNGTHYCEENAIKNNQIERNNNGFPQGFFPLDAIQLVEIVS